MATVSVPLPAKLEKRLDDLVASGVGSNRSDVMRRALEKFAEEEAIRVVLGAEREPTLRGDLRKILKELD
ncbi:ribbon-helix-helix domain-containing protein [Patescibacteria group bacterium]|nr:ribbon-helix-helix domain-containing protein [Patescibacteria group bacterium]